MSLDSKNTTVSSFFTQYPDRLAVVPDAFLSKNPEMRAWVTASNIWYDSLKRTLDRDRKALYDMTGTSATTVDGSTTEQEQFQPIGDYLVPGPITTSGLTSAAARLIGRTGNTEGNVQEISVGTGLQLANGVLSATGSGTGNFTTLTVGSLTGIVNAVSGLFGTATIGASLSYSGTTLNTIQDIRTGASPTFVGATFTGSITAAGTINQTSGVTASLAGTGVGTANIATLSTSGAYRVIAMDNANDLTWYATAIIYSSGSALSIQNLTNNKIDVTNSSGAVLTLTNLGTGSKALKWAIIRFL